MCSASDYLYKKKKRLVSNPEKNVQRRFSITTQSVESFNNSIKRCGKDVISIIHHAVQFSEQNYEKSRSLNYSSKDKLTHEADNRIREMIVDWARSDFPMRHHNVDGFQCDCGFYQDTGFPCYGVISVIMRNHFNFEDYVDPLWHVSRMRACFQNEENIINTCSKKTIVQSHIHSISQDFTELSAKSYYLWKTCKTFRTNLEKLVNDHSKTNLIPPLSKLITDAYGRPKTKRYLSKNEK